MFIAAVIWPFVSLARLSMLLGWEVIVQVPRSSQNQSGGKTAAPRAEGNGWFAVEVDPFLGCVNGAVGQALQQHEGKGGAGGEKQLAKGGTIGAFNGASTLKC